MIPAAAHAGAPDATMDTAQPSAESAPQNAQGGNQVGDIIVTAERREERIQDVPIAITALGSQELQNRGVQDIGDLASATPNVTFQTTSQGVLATTVGIRGLRNNNIELVTEQPAAIYIDGVYQSTAIGSQSLLGPDVERIEVLRGPQGTLFGRNTVGGAVLITTRRPQPEWEGRAMFGLASNSGMEGQAMINIPLAEGIATRFNVGYRADNGFANETTYGVRLGATRQFTARGQMLFTPNDRVNILISADYLRGETDGNLTQPVFLTDPTFHDRLTGATHSLTFTDLAIYYGLAPIPANYQTVRDRYFACAGGQPNLNSRCWSRSPGLGPTTTGFFSANADLSPGAFYRDYGGAINMAFDLTDNVQFRSITAYREFQSHSSKDYDNSPAIILQSTADPSASTLTQEGQLNGRLFQNRLKFALGVFYYRFDGEENATNLVLADLTGPNAANFLLNKLLNESLGFYGQTTFAVTDNFNLTAGLRYSIEDKSVHITQYQSRAAPVNQVCTLPLPNAECVNSANLHYTSLDYTFGADYKFNPDFMIYVRVARGFQAGGINQRSTTGVPFAAYQPQTAINYEAGFKLDAFDRAVRLDVAAFQTDITGLQRPVPQTFIDSAGNPVTVVATLNAADARMRGIEAELTWVPFRNARISAQVGYLDPQYGTFLATGPLGPNTLDLSNTDFQQISNWTFGISPSYTLPTSFGSIHFQADYFYQSRQSMQPALSYPADDELPVPGVIQPGYGLLNARIAARIGDDTEIAIYGRNILDKRYITGSLNVANSLGFAFANVGNPRVVGIQLSHNF